MHNLLERLDAPFAVLSIALTLVGLYCVVFNRCPPWPRLLQRIDYPRPFGIILALLTTAVGMNSLGRWMDSLGIDIFLLTAPLSALSYLAVTIYLCYLSIRGMPPLGNRRK